MRGYPLRSFSLRAEGVSLCPECVTGAVTPHPMDRGSLRIHGGSSLRPMSLKWWRCPRWFPHISEGSAGFQRAHELFGCSQSFYCPGTSRSFSICRLLQVNSVARVDQNPGHPHMHQPFSSWQECTGGRTSPLWRWESCKHTALKAGELLYQTTAVYRGL